MEEKHLDRGVPCNCFFTILMLCALFYSPFHILPGAQCLSRLQCVMLIFEQVKGKKNKVLCILNVKIVSF